MMGRRFILMTVHVYYVNHRRIDRDDSIRAFMGELLDPEAFDFARTLHIPVGPGGIRNGQMLPDAAFDLLQDPPRHFELRSMSCGDLVVVGDEPCPYLCKMSGWEPIEMPVALLPKPVT